MLGLSWQTAALFFALLSRGGGRSGADRHAVQDAAARPRPRRSTGAAKPSSGRVFTLETPIKDGEGRIRVDDSSWRVTGADRFAGAKVRVVRVEGTTLVVDDP